MTGPSAEDVIQLAAAMEQTGLVVQDGLNHVVTGLRRDRVMRVILVTTLVLDLVLTIVVTFVAVLFYRDHSTLNAVESGNGFIQSCLDPTGKCFQESLKAQSDPKAAQVQAAVGWCTSHSDTVSLATDCVVKELNRIRSQP